MKFICPNCNAKYQIADEKVAGRTVRMKCRKCDHLIQISKALGQLSTGPVSVRDDGAEAAPPSLPDPVPVSAPKPAPPAAPPKPPSPPMPAPSHVIPALRPPSSPRAAVPPLSAATPASPTPSAAASQSALPRLEPTLPSAVPGSALTEAFRAPEPRVLSDPVAGPDEWHVGINGVVVGPIKLSELRSKAVAGAVTLDSLVWREGFDEWKPLKTFPELVAVVEESLSSARASLAPQNPAGPPSLPRPPVAVPVERPGMVTGAALVTEPLSSEQSPVARRASTPAALWLAIIVAVLFGLTLGFFFFGQNTTPSEVVEQPAAPAATREPEPAEPVPSANPAQGEPDTAASAALASPERVPKRMASKATAAHKAAAEVPAGGLLGLKGLGSQQASGPTAGPASDDKQRSGRALSSDEIQRVVASHTGSVKRSCWQPALDTRDKDAPTSARIVVTPTIAPSGRVQLVTTSGDPPGYRGLAACIAGRVRTWQFPAASETTTVNVPFVFAAQ